MGIGKIISDAAKLLMMGIGVSDAGTMPRRVDLWQIAAGDEWRLFHCTASNVNHKGKEAVRLAAADNDGLALYDGQGFSNCKIDLSLAGMTQRIGLAVRVQSEAEFETFFFAVDAEAQALRLRLEFGAERATVELPPPLLGEWIPLRVVLNRQFTAVFVNGGNMPSLKVSAAPEYTAGGRIGFRIERGAEVLIADLKYIQPGKRDFDDV